MNMCRVSRFLSLRHLLLHLFLLTVLFPAADRPALAQVQPSQSPPAVKPLTLLRVSPSGQDVPAAREIVFQFSEAVAPVGRMQRDVKEIPVQFDPPLNCEWRWLNTTSLSCQLKESDALKPATRYRIVPKESPEGEEGRKILPAIVRYLSDNKPGQIPRGEFVTELPKLTSHYFRRWKGPATPTIYVYFNLDVTRASLESHLYFSDANGKRVPISVSNEPETLPVPESSKTYLVSPSAELGLDATARLQVEPGIQTVAGGMLSAENRVVVEFDTFPPFRFLGTRCCNESGPANSNSRCWGGQPFEIAPGTTPGDRCNPQDNVSLLFSAPVMKKTGREAIESEPRLFKKTSAASEERAEQGNSDGGEEFEESPYGEDEYEYFYEEPHKKGWKYEFTLPYGLKAHTEYKLTAKKDALTDIFARPLEEDLNAALLTDHRVSRLVFDPRLSVLEKNENTHLPVAVQNLDALILDYSVLSADGKTSANKEIPIDKPLDLSYYFPLKVRELIPNQSGVLYGTLQSKPHAVRKEVPDHSFFVTQVTPFHVHVKYGHHNTLVWVSSLDKGLPVAGAQVSAYTESPCRYEGTVRAVAAATTAGDGVAMLPGRATLDPALKLSTYWSSPHCDDVLKIKVQKGKDLAIVPLIHDMRLSPREYGNRWLWGQSKIEHGHIHAWGTTPQGIYKLGQLIQYKVYVRDQSNEQFVPAPRETYSLTVLDPTGKTVHERANLALSDFGALDGEFTTAENGAVGWYQFVLKAKFQGDEEAPGRSGYWARERMHQWQPMQVLVSDFTPASFKVKTELQGTQFKAGDEVKASSFASLYAGGPYAKAQARVTAQVVGGSLQKDYPRFGSFSFEPYERNRYFDEETPVSSSQIDQLEAALNDEGRLESTFKLDEGKISSATLYGTLSVETAVRDDRGKHIAGSASAKFAARDRYAGVHYTDWTFEKGKPLTGEVVVIDPTGAIVPGAKVTLVHKREKVVASRVKGAGNAYTTHYESTWEEIERREVDSAESPLAVSFSAGAPGPHVLEASVTDTSGKIHVASAYTWVFGEGPLMWEQEDGNRLDILPEKTQAKVGEKVRVLVKNPFPGGRALVTVERFGVIKRWFETLKQSTQIVSVPVTADMLPGFYLSIVVMSPRVEKPLGEGDVDLGKPAVRMGYATIHVEDGSKELKVAIKTDRDLYKPRDQVKVRLKGSAAVGPTPPMEFAVAVLDESVFDLIKGGSEYFDPYSGFYSLDDLDLDNYNLLLELVGKRKFEKKGANSGGDGGALAKRSLFKFVSYWNPSLPAAKDGSASFFFHPP